MTTFPVSAIKRTIGARAGGQRSSERGAALLEYALLLPVLLLLMLNTANFAPYLFAWITVNDAARAATEYQIYNGAAVGQQSIPTAAQVEALVTSEVQSLHNNPSVTVEICSNNSSSGTAVYNCSGTGTAFTPPADPDPTRFVLTAVIINYTYQPIAGLFTLPIINVPLTIPPTTMTRRIVMRNIQ
jgi:Flp pilus assembly protein TadG